MENNIVFPTQLDANMAQAAQDAQMGKLCIDPEKEAKFKGCIVDMNTQYSANEFIFEVDNLPVITRGDLHTIGAKQKAGKTSLISILLSAIICGQWNRVKCIVPDLKVLYIDTEMKKIDTQQLGVKALTMAGGGTLPDRIHLVNFRSLYSAELEEAVYYFMDRYAPDLLIIDGVVDFCPNFNDVELSQHLVIDFLMKLAEQKKCAIINVLHTNKTDNFSELRGHLGAFFEQKGGTIIKCEKDENTNVVTVTFPTHRYAPVPEFHFTFSEEGIPVCADDQYQEMVKAKQRSKEEQKAAEQAKIYRQRSGVIVDVIRKHGGSVERKVLVEEAMARLEKGKSTVTDLIKAMKEDACPVITECNSVIALKE